jgi:hypothetical protein
MRYAMNIQNLLYILIRRFTYVSSSKNMAQVVASFNPLHFGRIHGNYFGLKQMIRSSFKKQTALLVFVVTTCCATAQSRLSPADSTHLQILVRELSLSETQTEQADSILRFTSARLTSIDKELVQVSRSSLSVEEKEAKQSVLKEKKKTEKENRDLSIVLLLTPEQRTIYDSKIKPAKPGVLHMGMNHDRAQCGICVVK